MQLITDVTRSRMENGQEKPDIRFWTLRSKGYGTIFIYNIVARTRFEIESMTYRCRGEGSTNSPPMRWEVLYIFSITNTY